MKHFFTLSLLICISFFTTSLSVNAVNYSSSKSEESSYTTLRNIDLGTYNEYRYRLTEQFFAMREYFEVNKKLERGTLQNIALIANTGYKYLPDNLQNQNLLRELLIDIQKGVKSPENSILYTEIVKSLADYLERVQISSITGNIEATPSSGNAPLTTTFRAAVQDPSGTQIISGNYTWWVDSAGKKVVIGRGPSINFTFKEEGIYSVFLDVSSSHKNKEGYTDVLPFRGRVNIQVQEKVASLIISIDGDRVADNEVLKFTPDDANYGLLFDASSSTPTGGAKFVRTSWDFGNGATRNYNGPPKIERVRYGTQGDYNVRLRLETNEGKVVERSFALIVRDPIARIETNRDDGFIGDSFTFTAKSSGLERNLRYNWEIIDIENDTVVLQKSDRVLTHVFTKKGKFNVRLNVRQSSGEVDQDSYIVYVTSQAPIAQFTSSVPQTNKPNKILLDASRSHDPDFSDDGNLKYDWFIDGERAVLSEANKKGSVGFYTFDSIGTHSINLEVTDPDGMVAIKKGSVTVNSILSVEMEAFPRVIQRGGFIKFDVSSPEAEVYEWDFGDGKTSGGSTNTITHTYEKSGTFNARVTVTDSDNNKNTYIQSVYVSESNTPLAHINVSYGTLESPEFDEQACEGSGAFVVDRVGTMRLDATDSINIDGSSAGLEYSWKIGQGKFASSANVSHRFDEIGCFPVKLTVKSTDNGRTHAREVMMDVRNLEPTLSAVGVTIENPDEDPLIIRVTAQGAKDPDGVIQSYLWYYYTDIDTEPQDFRSTISGATSFVIPKVTGNYYFVAILKDNNEARVTSEEITGSRYFTTITGDNINTPIIELSVNDTSTIIGEEITFTAKARNILGQSVEKDASFSWDFDGDGFYDTQTSEASTTHVYRKSGEFYAKVKVKYKGISSTKNVTMNVGNKLVPDFGYISVGNTFIFFDNSTGKIDSRQWDLGDGTTKTGTNFSHTYTDKLSIHDVTLKISEGSKFKEVQKKVRKNIKNILKSKGKSFVGFSFPETNENGNIILESPSEKVFIYMGEGGGDNMVYAIDYDIENDSDLNGGTDDDEDNAGTASYTSGDVTEIPLTKYKTQTLRMFTKSPDGTIFSSQDITITKNYIEESSIDPDSLVFEGVTDSEKQKIERLKEILSNLPQQQRLESLSYVQKLQENWNDNTEKTRTILDFENYIFDLALEQEDEIIELLESLLVEGQEDQSAKQITYTALINLIPQDIECEVTSGSCYDSLMAKLEDIRNSDDIEYNKGLGKEILEVVGNTDLMTSRQKLDFKAILTSFVYGGNVEDIPDAEKQEVISQEIPAEQSEGGGILGIFFTILKWIGILLGVFLLILLVLYILYLIFGKNKSAGFSSFVSNITSFKKDDAKSQKDSSESNDILADFEAETVSKQSDILSGLDEPKAEKQTKSPSLNAKDKEASKEVSLNAAERDDVLSGVGKTEDVPDWLKGNFPSDADTKQEPILSVSPEKKPEAKSPKKSEPKPVEKTAEKPKQENKASEKKQALEKPKAEKEEIDIDEATKIEEENIPDWLKGAADFSKKPEPKQEEKKPEKDESQTNTQTQPQEKPKQNGSQDKIETPKEDDVPDWLKGSFDMKKQETPESSNTSPKEKKGTKTEEVKTESSQNINSETSQNTPQGEEKKTTEKTSKAVLDDSNVPDWLKGSFDTKKEEPKTAEKKSDSTQDPSLNSLPPKDKGGNERSDYPEVKAEQREATEKSVEKKAVRSKNTEEKTPPKQEGNAAPQPQKPRQKQKPKKQQSEEGETTKASETRNKETQKPKTEKSPAGKTQETPKKKDSNELWDDGMKIPDWLKTDD